MAAPIGMAFSHRLACAAARRRLAFPATVALALLQRVPALRPEWSAAPVVWRASAALLARGVAWSAGALGAVHTLAGATVVNVSAVPGLALRAGEAATIAASVSGGTVSFARAWDITGAVPPGLTVVDGVARGGAIVVNPSNGVLVIRGTPTAAGSYTLTVRGWHDNTLTGANASRALAITVTPAPVAAPAIATQPLDQTAVAGGAVAFRVSAGPADSGLTYQWRKDGAALPGATDATLTLPAVQAADAGAYSVAVTNAAGSVTSTAARLTIAEPAEPGRLVNLAIRTRAGAGDETLILGFTLAGPAGANPKALLLRAVGPSLAAFGVEGVLADPVLRVLAGAEVVAVNDNWSGAAAVAAAAARVGAFPLASATSADAALHAMPGSGGYTMQVAAGDGRAGMALAEIYDAMAGEAFDPRRHARLTNVSARARVGAGGEVLIAGLAIGGGTPRTVLIRGVGPGLEAFGVAGALADPKLTLFAGNTALAANDDWGGDAAVARAAAQVGAFALASDAKDAALLVTLAPGSYTAQLGGPAGTSGVALVEVYEVP